MKTTITTILLSFSILIAQGITNTLGGSTDGDRFIIENQSGGKIFTATGIGTVGIGVVNPAHKLDIDGRANMLQFKMPTGANNGYVLTSDGSGNGTWQELPTASADSDWTIDDNNLIMAQSGKIIIGDRDNAKLNVTTYTGDALDVTTYDDNGYGIYASGRAGGIWGDGIDEGIRGEAFTVGGTGINGGGNKYGVKGRATANSGLHYGGFFETENPSGRGLYATNTTSSGSAYGGVFEAKNSDDGVGAWADGKKYDFYAAGAGTDYGAASSIRWKKNIVEIDNPLEKLSKIRGVYFDWDQEHGGTHDIGCIAEEVGKVLPEIVTFEANGIDAEGMDYSKLTPLLIEAVKAQQVLIGQLFEEIEQLKN